MPPIRVPNVTLSDSDLNKSLSPSTQTSTDKVTPKKTTTTTTPTKTTTTATENGVFQSPFQSLRRLRRRRARSAPPTLRQPLIGHHFRIDSTRRVVLPGVPQHEEDWYRDTHDFFNLIVLIPIVVLDVINWNWEKLFHLKKKETLADAWTGEWFDLFFICTACYFVIDLFWIILVPKCVKSPSTIIQHHIATLIYIMMPFFIPDLRYFMGACMSVSFYVDKWGLGEGSRTRISVYSVRNMSHQLGLFVFRSN